MNKKIITLILFLSSPQIYANGLTLSAIGPQTLILGELRPLTLQIQASEDFAGTNVRLEVRRETLNSLDASGEISLVTTSEPLSIAAGQTVETIIEIQVDPHCVSFGFSEQSHFEIFVSNNENGSSTQASQQVEISVQPTYEIRLFGRGAPETWSSPETLLFRSHEGGVRLRFVNYDTEETHIVHGSGAIPHGPTDRPLDVSHDGQPGGSYEVTITSTQQNFRGIYYCHMHESSDFQRNVYFNSTE